MPHRRSRKASAVFMCGVMTLFLWQGSVYPAYGHGSRADVQLESRMAFSVQGAQSGLQRIIVQPGETVWGLAQRYRTTVKDIAQLNQLSEPNRVKAGAGIWVQSSSKPSELPEPSESPQRILTSDSKAQVVDIWMGEELTTASPTVQKAIATQVTNPSRGDKKIAVSPADRELLVRVIYAEARGENFDGQVAVGAVVLNRVKDPRFPKSIHEVIYQPGAFTAVDDRQIHLQPDETADRAAEAALSGIDPTGGAIYYYNPHLATDRWIKSRQVIKRIGNHTFSI
ncbi:MAG: cell wall hydrolase [Desulfitobacteriaceae bacterium]